MIQAMKKLNNFFLSRFEKKTVVDSSVKSYSDHQIICYKLNLLLWNQICLNFDFPLSIYKPQQIHLLWLMIPSQNVPYVVENILHHSLSLWGLDKLIIVNNNKNWFFFLINDIWEILTASYNLYWEKLKHFKIGLSMFSSIPYKKIMTSKSKPADLNIIP